MSNKNRKRSTQAKATTTKGKHSIKRYFIDKQWDTTYRLQAFNQEEVIRRLENNLPLDDLYTTLDNKYKHKKNVNK